MIHLIFNNKSKLKDLKLYLSSPSTIIQNNTRNKVNSIDMKLLKKKRKGENVFE